MGAGFIFLVTCIVSALLLLTFEASRTFPTTYGAPMYSTYVCHDGFMSVYLSKKQFADLPHTIYIQDAQGGYYQAVSIATPCHFFLEETEVFVILTVEFGGCFVKSERNSRSLLVVVMAPAKKKQRVEIAHTIPVICESAVRSSRSKNATSRDFCNKDGFSIIITQNSTVPPLNLDALWIPASEKHKCKPQRVSSEAVIFSFPFSDCGTRSTVANGMISHWINIEAKPERHAASVFRSSPFNLSVRCSFALAQMTQLRFNVEGDESKPPSALRSEGTLRTEMRFAKDSTYTSFYSPRDPPPTIELGQPVFVEVFVLKHHGDHDLALRLEDCWATPTENPHDPQRWDLLVQGCPFKGDSQRTVVLPVVSSRGQKHPSLHKHFVVKLFSFVKPTSSHDNMVFFHCDAAICKGSACSQTCSRRRRKLRRIMPRAGNTIYHRIISVGPLHFLL